MNSYKKIKKLQDREEKSPAINELILLNGLSFPGDEELVSVILSACRDFSSASKTALEVLEAIKAFPRDELPEKLMTIPGMNEKSALMISCAVELGRRFSIHRSRRIMTPGDILPFVKQFTLEHKETFVTISLTGAQEIINIRVNAIGILDRAIIHPREIFCDPVSEHASAVICCHNHPQGNCCPSPADIDSTKVLCRSAEILGLTLLDHIIITTDNYFSFREHGLINPRKKGRRRKCVDVACNEPYMRL